VRLDTLVPGDSENLLALARDALDVGDIAKAKRAVERLKPSDTRNATFHVVSARLAMDRGDLVSAETHVQEACLLDPDDDRHKLILATLRLDPRKPQVRAAALETLNELAAKPAVGVRAIRALLTDAQQNEHPARLRELADRLTSAPDSTFSDKLRRLEILRILDSPDSASVLVELHKAAEADPGLISQLLTWMYQNDLAMVASEWPATLPADVAATPRVRLAIAHTYAKAGQWSKLRQAAEGSNWGDLDFMRRAFLARALERLLEPETGAAEWKNAVSVAQGAPDGPGRLEQLAKAAQLWHWDQRAEEVFWLLTKTGQCPRWVLNALWSITYARTDTAQLQTVASLIANADPGGVSARNNYTLLCLLTRTQEGDPHRTAKALYNENPDNPEVALTYAVSLYQQKKAQEAVAITSDLKSEELRKPGAIYPFYHAVFLIATDRTAEAEEFLQIAGNRVLMPEEKGILIREKAAAKKRAEDARARELKSSRETAAPAQR
jgi:predicted Zn-dependent protease